MHAAPSAASLRQNAETTALAAQIARSRFEMEEEERYEQKKRQLLEETKAVCNGFGLVSPTVVPIQISNSSFATYADYSEKNEGKKRCMVLITFAFCFSH